MYFCGDEHANDELCVFFFYGPLGEKILSKKLLTASVQIGLQAYGNRVARACNSRTSGISPFHSHSPGVDLYEAASFNSHSMGTVMFMQGGNARVVCEWHELIRAGWRDWQLIRLNKKEI